MIMESTVRTSLQIILGLLVDGEYETLAAMTQGKCLSAEEIRTAVESYGRTLTYPPDGELPPGTDVFQLSGSFPRRLAVVMPLYTEEEGRSDLSVELTMIEIMPNLWVKEIDNIHVM